MSGPMETFRAAMAERWDELTALGAFTPYGQPLLVYGYEEARRIKDLDRVAEGRGRVVFHAGDWPGPDASAGELDGNPMQAYGSGRNIASSLELFTVHCHGYDPAFADQKVTNVSTRHEDAAWVLQEAFVAAVEYVRQLPSIGTYMTLGQQWWVRDPGERRFGELRRFQFSIRLGVRRAPAFPTVYLTPTATGTVETPNGSVVLVDQGG